MNSNMTKYFIKLLNRIIPMPNNINDIYNCLEYNGSYQLLLGYQKETEAKEKQFAEQHKALREREQKLFELSASLEEREKLLANIDAELAQKRADVEQAKIANSKIEDHTDYKEDETRKLKIDLMLEEAGWEIGTSVREEVAVTGMPSPSGKGAVDYVLYDANGLPLAVVELRIDHVSQRCGDVKTGSGWVRVYDFCATSASRA
jgi:hypothetical protein